MSCCGNYGRYWGPRRRFMRGGMCPRDYGYDGFGGRRFVDSDRDDLRSGQFVDSDRDYYRRGPFGYDRDSFMRRGY